MPPLESSKRRLSQLTMLLILQSVLLTGCYIKTQRMPAPMESTRNPLPAGSLDLYPPGPEEVVVVRHADPVQIRPAGLSSSFPLPFYDKQARLNSGSWIFCGAGGRAEILWPSGGTVLLFDSCTGVIGSNSRGEPRFIFRAVERARIILREGERIALLGGALLTVEDGFDDAELTAGPFVIEHHRAEIMRLTNRGKRTGRLYFREEVFDIDPGHVIDIPLLEAGGSPLQVDPGFQTLPGGLETRGQVELVDDASGTRLRAVGEHELRGRGVRLRLDVGEEAVFMGLDAGSAPSKGATSKPATDEPGTLD